MAGSLEVVDGERIVITASMTKGTVKVTQINNSC